MWLIQKASFQSMKNDSSVAGAAADDSSLEMRRQERQLIDGMLVGDESAWQSFIQQYGALIRWRVADVAGSYDRANDSSTIDDVTAEVVATLLAADGSALRAFQQRSSFSTYLAVIATRVATRVLARLSRHDGRFQNDEMLEHASSSMNSDQSNRIIDDEQRQLLLRLVDRLPPRQRMIVEMHYKDGHTYTQISERLGIPIGSIGVTLRRAEARLRSWIDDG